MPLNPTRLTICVIIAVYKKPRELQFVLESLEMQSRLPDEVIVTEDDVSTDIPAILAQFQTRLPKLTHLSQVNQGFGKCRALNHAIKHSKQDLLLFTDGDCLFRSDFIETHLHLAREKQFVTGGGHINIHQDFHSSTNLTPAIQNQTIFSDTYFKLNTCGVIKLWRLKPPTGLKKILNWVTRRNALNGCNACVWRSDVIRAGGFDEAMGYGAEDLNLGIRLNNLGVIGRSYRYSLPHLHLDHARSYKNQAQVNNNVTFNRSIKHSSTVLPRKSVLL